MPALLARGSGDGTGLLGQAWWRQPLFRSGSLGAGLLTRKVTYENGLLKMNYTGGDTCHKVYQRSTTIFFHCDRSTQRVSGLPAAGRPPGGGRLPHAPGPPSALEFRTPPGSCV